MRIVLTAAILCLAAPASAQATYGRSTTFGRLKCVSRRLGMTCRSLAGGHGFRVSVEKQETF